MRSRQKNIYKDKREKKPDHLVVGNKDYKGRPLTAETRAKLNLPASKSSSQVGASSSWKSSWDDAPESTIDAMPLAVEVEDKVVNDKKPKKKSRKKQSKYKNIG